MIDQDGRVAAFADRSGWGLVHEAVLRPGHRKERRRRRVRGHTTRRVRPCCRAPTPLRSGAALPRSRSKGGPRDRGDEPLPRHRRPGRELSGLPGPRCGHRSAASQARLSRGLRVAAVHAYRRLRGAIGDHTLTRISTTYFKPGVFRRVERRRPLSWTSTPDFRQ